MGLRAMVLLSRRLLAATIILSAFLQAEAQETGLLTFFVPDSEPKSLEVSIIAVNTAVNPIATYESDPVTILLLDCPKAETPANDACRAAGIYPAQAYHTQGSVWGGTTTFAADNSTTTWRCELGSPWTTGGTSTRSGDGARCSKTIVASGATRTESSAFDPCYRVAHQLPIVVTAGGEKLGKDPYLTINATELDSIYSNMATSMDCPSTTETVWVASSGSTSPTGSGTQTTTTSSQESPTQTPTASTGSGTTDGSASVTARPTGGAGRLLTSAGSCSYLLFAILAALGLWELKWL
ncbi:hypothetical protein GE09DRAFT_1072695 [Coniochaeta sp. 2T2.1]|nr:hypothetical protein GE09DRAFT_1072695 [Coniochaeta sp. 2T2.1]